MCLFKITNRASFGEGEGVGVGTTVALTPSLLLDIISPPFGIQVNILTNSPRVTTLYASPDPPRHSVTFAKTHKMGFATPHPRPPLANGRFNNRFVGQKNYTRRKEEITLPDFPHEEGLQRQPDVTHGTVVGS